MFDILVMSYLYTIGLIAGVIVSLALVLLLGDNSVRQAIVEDWKR